MQSGSLRVRLRVRLVRGWRSSFSSRQDSKRYLNIHTHVTHTCCKSRMGTHTHSCPLCHTCTRNVPCMALNYAQIHTGAHRHTHLFLLISRDNAHTRTGGSYYALRLECFDGIIAVTSEEKETEWGMGMEGERERKKEESADTLSMLMLWGSTPPVISNLPPSLHLFVSPSSYLTSSTFHRWSTRTRGRWRER